MAMMPWSGVSPIWCAHMASIAPMIGMGVNPIGDRHERRVRCAQCYLQGVDLFLYRLTFTRDALPRCRITRQCKNLVVNPTYPRCTSTGVTVRHDVTIIGLHLAGMIVLLSMRDDRFR
jgi:hypothetical protein